MIKDTDINYLKNRLKEVDQFLSSYDKNDLSFAQELEKNSFQAHKEELLQKIRQQEEVRRNEIVELRLIGHAMNGSIPLSFFSQLSESIFKSISYAAGFIRYGEEVKNKKLEQISNDIDLRLSGIANGSTRVFISGSLSKDLVEVADQEMGLLEETLENIFKLLKAEKEDDIKQIVSSIGTKSTVNLRKLMEILENKNIIASLTWNAPREILYNWGGSMNAVVGAKEKLSRNINLPPTKDKVSGVISSLSDTGIIKIRGVDGKTQVSIKYTNQQYVDVQRLSLGDTVSLNVMKFTHIDETTEKEKITYRLITSS